MGEQDVVEGAGIGGTKDGDDDDGCGEGLVEDCVDCPVQSCLAYYAVDGEFEDEGVLDYFGEGAL